MVAEVLKAPHVRMCWLQNMPRIQNKEVKSPVLDFAGSFSGPTMPRIPQPYPAHPAHPALTQPHPALSAHTQPHPGQAAYPAHSQAHPVHSSPPHRPTMPAMAEPQQVAWAPNYARPPALEDDAPTFVVIRGVRYEREAASRYERVAASRPRMTPKTDPTHGTATCVM